MASQKFTTEQYEQKIADLEQRLNRAYSERNYAAILAAKTCAAYGRSKEGMQSGWYVDDTKPQNDPEWNTVVCFTGDTGQVSWHMSPDSAELAQKHLRQIDPNWDGTFLSRTPESLNTVRFDPNE